MKTKIFNLIILDKSGSMSSIASAAIAGVNETIGSIKASAKKHSEDQEHFFSLVAFCECERKYIFENVLRPITSLVAARRFTMLSASRSTSWKKTWRMKRAL